jgi:deoxycytidylate deaminase
MLLARIITAARKAILIHPLNRMAMYSVMLFSKTRPCCNESTRKGIKRVKYAHSKPRSEPTPGAATSRKLSPYASIPDTKTGRAMVIMKSVLDYLLVGWV